MTDVKKLVEEYGDQIVKNRRYLHAHPELSFHETNTAAWIRDHLTKAGIELMPGITGNSTVGILKGSQPGPSIGLRADFDALGLTETNDLPYKSTNPGVMHACGHDAHASILMAVAETLAHHRELVHGTVYFVFEQGEEFLPGGAQQLVKDGVMDSIDYMFAIHVNASAPLGQIDIHDGVRFAAVGTYDFKIRGKGGHGGFPHKANNPIFAASELVNDIALIPALKCDPLANCTVSVSYLHCGVEGVANVIPETVSMGGCVRVLDTALRQSVMEEIERLGNSICAAHQCEIKTTMVYGYPACKNDTGCVSIMQDVATSMGITNADCPPSLGAEDFGYFSEQKPAAVAWFGMGDPTGAHELTPHHNPKFYLYDGKGLPLALEYMLSVYLKAANTL